MGVKSYSMVTEQQQNLITKIILEKATGKDFLDVSGSFDYLRYFFLDGDVADTLKSFCLKVIAKPQRIIILDGKHQQATIDERYYLYTPGADIIQTIMYREDYLYRYSVDDSKRSCVLAGFPLTTFL